MRGSSAEAEAAGAATRDALARVSGSELLTPPEPEDRSPPRPAGEATLVGQYFADGGLETTRAALARASRQTQLGARSEPGLDDPTAGSEPLPAPSRTLPSEPAVHDTSMLPPLQLLALPDPVLIELLCRLAVRDLIALRAAAAELFRGQAQWQGRGLVEETGRLLVARRADRELAPLLPQFGWLRSLEELRQLAQPLAFTAVHERLSTSNGGRSCTKAGAGAGYHTAFCHKAVMRRAQPLANGFPRCVFTPGAVFQGGGSPRRVQARPLPRRCLRWRGVRCPPHTDPNQTRPNL